VDDQRIVPAAEMELMSPDERHGLVNERVVTDLSQIDPAFLQEIRANAQAIHRARKAPHAQQK
jgi:hypothetical protein